MRAIIKSTSWRTSLFAAFFAVACLTPSVADAKRKKRKRRRPAVAAVAPVNVKALSELMGPFSFGMSKDRILKILSKQLKERYADRIKETSDVYEQDKLRQEQRKAIKKIRDSYKIFKGNKTGWDVSIIDDQFAHKSDESMLVYWENNADGKDQRRFFFFHEGQLYKMFITLDSSMFPTEQRTFDAFKSIMTQRYGGGKVVTATKHNGDVYPVLVDWASSKIHVQAIDKLHFYGSFCLSIASPGTESVVMSARDANKQSKRSNAVINSMLEDKDAPPPSLDSNKAAVDSILVD